MNHHYRLGRRIFLKNLGIVASVGALEAGCSKVWGLRNHTRGLTARWETRDFSVDGRTPLVERGAAKGILYGAFPQANHHQFAIDVEFQTCFARECGLLVNAAPWDVIHPAEDTFDFTQTDYFARFAAENNMILQGGSLLWHNSNPRWLIDKFKAPDTTSSAIEKILTNYITTFVGQYINQFHLWSVVNEAIDIRGGRSDNLRDTTVTDANGEETYPTWLHFLGADYIDLAFRIASSADPNALLFYNDYGLEYDLPGDESKRNAVLTLLEHLKTMNTPIHALGIQAHLRGQETRFNPTKLRNFLSDVASLGLDILITEIDVEDKELPVETSIRDRIVAGVYEDFLAVSLDEPAVKAVITWGLSDRYTWLSNFAPRADGEAARPLPLDAQLNPKLAWQAIAKAFDQSPQRESLRIMT